MPQLWTNIEDDRLVSHVPHCQGKGRQCIMDRGMLRFINTFCIQNAQVMEKWVQRYAETRVRREQERQAYRRAHGGLR